MTEEIKPIGYIVSGGLKDNLYVRLTVPAKSVQEGAFLVTETDDHEWLFYGLVTDLQLGTTDPRFADELSEERLPPLLAQVLTRPDAVHQPGDAAGTDAGTRPGAGQQGLRYLDPRDRRRSAGAAAPDPGQDHPAAPLAGAPGGSRRHRRNLRPQRRKTQLHHRLHPRTRAPGGIGYGEVRAALLRRVRRHRHRQVLPHPPAAGRSDRL